MRTLVPISETQECIAAEHASLAATAHSSHNSSTSLHHGTMGRDAFQTAPADFMHTGISFLEKAITLRKIGPSATGR